jgi:hypothetical protein
VSRYLPTNGHFLRRTGNVFLNRHFKVRTHPIFHPILTHPILNSGGFTRIRVGLPNSGGKSGGKSGQNLPQKPPKPKNFSSKIKKRKSGLVWANSLYTLAAISHARALLFYRMR